MVSETYAKAYKEIIEILKFLISLKKFLIELVLNRKLYVR